ncbi:thioredoxin domain-containing protein [Acetobacter orleanensis]|uniref:Uncharacterized protein n=1 Tax=Acetobacter orleanensis TaxID=104099 RepID=A0A4Y3TSY8_9PROT|nr:hypothetical protein [Acetobacter orleanensis]KXV62556.1 hypothetical protein AD949_10635 [Acetobacter orleanensis]PCD79998.1 hypothetical protein CO710_03840 [Acetobacter orleanensis]GAN68311.1 hypothetical protein Abol_015_150 [Acetobacter orleanensis JCM 7639]GBR29878.1 hypothetical protein AA0473_2137 [Acetobacter orleanensis NRIC 0473]GEB83875.1 hypothetical protein AOR01nite_23520 [Acetobacter orleanensis]
MSVAAIKTATKNALKVIGGIDAAERVCRVGRSQLSDYGNRNSLQCVPADVAVDLDISAQEPLILAAMAVAEGFRLVPVKFSGTGHIPQELAKFSKFTSEVLQEGIESLEDGQVDVAEARAILEHLHPSRLAMDRLEHALHKIIADNKPHIVGTGQSGAA